MMRTLNASQLRELVPMAEAVELMKAAFASSSRGETSSPLRTPIEMPDGSGVSLYMPAYVPGTGNHPAASGAKIVSAYGANAARGLPMIHAIVVMIDPATGIPIGLIEGGAMTALRTGAVSGAASDLLARADASVLTVIGAGVQGVTQAAAVAAVRSLEKIYVVDVNTESAESFAERLASWDAASAACVEVAASAADVLSASDIVCTATTSSTPVFNDTDIAPGTHINAVGAFTPQMQEIPVETLLRARIVVDQVEAALHEAGDFIIPIESGQLERAAVHEELGQIVNGDLPRRENSDQITFFKSVGNAIQDMIVGAVALERAEERGVGGTVDLS
jgi:ornithine cyclodeaminase/alanine dehydrogenase-like protein (mu-crystallin family)